MEAPGAFVGRAAPLAALREAALAPGPAAVVVTGTLGIGKTRLVDELAGSLRADGGRVAVGRAWPDGDGPALRPWFEVLDALAVSRDVLAGAGVDRADRFSRTLDALAALDPAPTIVLEDVHAADVETLLLARLVVRSAGGWRGTLLATRRPGPSGDPERDALLDAVEREAGAVVLAGLDADAVADLLRGDDTTVTDEVVALVVDLTGGNPLHLRTVAGAAGRGLAEQVDDHVRAMVRGLSPWGQRVLEAAAVVGGAASPAELAAAAAVAPTRVPQAVADAVGAGLLHLRDGSVVVGHEAIRQAVLGAMASARRADVEVRLATHLAEGDAEDRGRGAHHALSAAELGAAPVDDAVRTARQVARDLGRGPSLVTAVALLDRAVAVGRAGGRRPDPGLLVERAEATLRSGRLQDARHRFEEAATEADAAGDVVAHARAALGLGGVWLGEHRDRATAQRVDGLQLTALAALPADEVVLRARLALRIAAEEAYRRGSTDGLDAHLARVRATGDAVALVEGLSLVHHATMHPGRERERLALADEQLALASEVGDELSVLMALAWRAIDLFLVGDPAAERALHELSRRADAVQCQAVVYVARVMEAMVLLRAGRVDEAEAAAAACLGLGTAVGDADAVGYYGVHLLAVRALQARETEVLEVFEAIARSPEHPGADVAVLAACAMLAARAGQHARAKALLRECAGGGLVALKRSTTWLTAVVALADAACAVGDTDVAAQAHEVLVPHADLPVMPSFAVACFGSVERTLGTTALLLGRTDEAVAHLEAAVAACTRWEDRPAELQARSDLAHALLEAGEVGAAHRELGQAVAGARALGLTALADRWAAAAPAALWRPGPTMTPVEGGTWQLRAGATCLPLPDLVGCAYLAQLLDRPGREVSVLRLALQVDAVAGARHDVLDRTARESLRRRVDDLRAAVAAAEADGDVGAAAAHREELDDVARHLATALGLGGRVRSFDDLPERARTSVQKAIRRVVDRVDEGDPLLADHLRRHTRTGLTCCYDG